MEIFFTNSLTQKKELFRPHDPHEVKMYVCGPTVYDRMHIGNARSIFTFDIVNKLLKNFYTVCYTRNITDIDDKIISNANKSKQNIKDFTHIMIQNLFQDIQDFDCTVPDKQPKVTENIDVIIQMIKSLLEKGHAYVSNHNVYFNVKSFKDYGKLSNRQYITSHSNTEDNNKKNNLDFVLWKTTKNNEAAFTSPWGKGRPGWHIECSAISKKSLGNKIDIHGGGIDLIFPHHENETAQSKCESVKNQFVKYWLHNGFVTVDGRKMSKSLENFTTIRDLFNDQISPATIKYFFLTTHYRKPLNFTKQAIINAENNVRKLNSFCNTFSQNKTYLPKKFLEYLCDDLNTPKILSYLHGLTINQDNNIRKKLFTCCHFLGLLTQKNHSIDVSVTKLMQKRQEYKKMRNWKEADIIRKKIENRGYQILDGKRSSKIIKKM